MNWGGGTGRVQNFHCFWGQDGCDGKKWLSAVFARLHVHRLDLLCHVLGWMVVGEY